MFGWAWLDPMMGIVGAALVTIWARSLIRQTSSVLLDREMDEATTDSIREELEKGTPADKTVVADLHLWRVGNESYACAATVVTHNSQLDSEAIKNRLKSFKVAHTTLEIQVCKDV
jgi:Co/Zn/Cd efflux system component